MKFPKIRCPDCRKWTEQGPACDHCGCPLAEDAVADLVEGLAGVLREVKEQNNGK